MKPESYYFREEAITLGVPSSSIITTKKVFNTFQESVQVNELISRTILKRNNTYKIILVTSAFHMKRAKKFFERQGLLVIPFPVDFQSRGKWAGSIWLDPVLWIPTPGNLSYSSRALRELLGRIAHRSW